ncbi:MAG: class I SAM-dependent methyltransferase [Acidobacteria bacterium]|nr:class I SAM-dependent methyltransferase [Acidobacteriota bacterium]
MRNDRPRDPDQWFRRPMYRKPRHALEFQPGSAFFELADAVVRRERTLLGYECLYSLWQAVRNVADVPGAVAEIGTYQGGSAYFIASALVAITGGEVPMRVFDTFEGHPVAAITEHDPFHAPGKFSKTRYEDVQAYLSAFRQLEIYKGDVAASLPHLAAAVYRLVHIDTDLYRPTIACLEYFGPCMSPGGIIVIDDYASKKCPGVPKAVSEYMQQTDAFAAWDLRTAQVALVRR